MPQEAPTPPAPAPASPEAVPAASAPGFAIPALEPEPEHASSAGAAGYPTFGTPYRSHAASSPYTNAAAAVPLASPYTNAAASPYPSGATSPSTSPPPPPLPPLAAPYPGAPTTGYPGAGFPTVPATPSRFGSDMGVAGTGAVGNPYGAGVRAPGYGPAPTLGAPAQAMLESAFRSGATEKANGDRQTALIVGGLGVGLLVVAGGVLRATLSTGTGTVWTWGFLAGGALLVKAAMSYVSAVRRGARHLGPLGWTVSGGALLLAGVVVATSVQAAFSPMPVEVGSCFTDEGLEVHQVDCGEPHDYTAVAVVDSLGECPSSSDIFARLDGEVVCLVDAGPGLGN